MAYNPPPSPWSVAGIGGMRFGDYIRDRNQQRKQDARIAMLDQRQQDWRTEDIARREAEREADIARQDEAEARRLLLAGATPATMGQEARPNGLNPVPQVVGAGGYIRPNPHMANVGGKFFDVSSITPQAQEERRLAQSGVDRIQGLEDQKEMARFTAGLRPPPRENWTLRDTDQGLARINEDTGEVRIVSAPGSTPAPGGAGAPLRSVSRTDPVAPEKAASDYMAEAKRMLQRGIAPSEIQNFGARTDQAGYRALGPERRAHIVQNAIRELQQRGGAASDARAAVRQALAEEGLEVPESGRGGFKVPEPWTPNLGAPPSPAYAEDDTAKLVREIQGDPSLTPQQRADLLRKLGVRPR
jgi:hypothetical protein